MATTPRRAIRSAGGQVPLVLLASFVLLVFLTGGSARGDVLSLVALRPIAVLALTAALIAGGGRRLWRDHRATAVFALAIFALVVIQLVPLPPSLWMQFPSREVMAEVDRAVGILSPWRPISMVPARTWNSLFALFVPAAALLLLTAVGMRARWPLVYVLTAVGIVSAFIGLLQATGAGVYLYRVSTVGEAAGLFSNRNHQAVYLACLFPILAILAGGRGESPRQDGLLRIIAISIAVLLIPLLLVTGSRAGLMAGAIGLASVPWIYAARPRPAPQARAWRKRRGFALSTRQAAIVAVAGIALLGSMTIIGSRAESVRRLLHEDTFQSRRGSVFTPVMALARRQVTTGSGFGTFADVYKVDEPDAVLAPTYLNQAHNDWAQVVIEGGIAGIALLLWAVGGWIVLVSATFRRTGTEPFAVSFARAGASITLILGIASVFDYPLRTPALAAVFVIATAFMLFNRQAGTAGGHEDRTTNGDGRVSDGSEA